MSILSFFAIWFTTSIIFGLLLGAFIHAGKGR